MSKALKIIKNVPFLQAGCYGHPLKGYPYSEHLFLFPLVNIYEERNRYFILVTVPGLSRKDVMISNHGQEVSVTVSDRRKEKHQWLVQEFHLDNYCRKFVLPDEYDANHTDADFDKGLLKLSFNKYVINNRK